MKKKLFILFSFFIVEFSYAQTASDLYKKGDSLYGIKDYKNSALAYTEGIRLEGAAATPDRYWDAASLWTLADLADSAFVYLNALANSKTLTFDDFITIVNDVPYFTSIKKDTRWQEVKDKLFSNAKKTFSLALQKSGGTVPDYERTTAAFSWALMNNNDSAFFQLQTIANTKGVVFGTYNSIRTSTILSSLHNDNRWKPLLDKIYKNAENSFSTPKDNTYTQEEIIYGRKNGMALTMIHLKPKINSKQKAIIQIISGSWRSNILNWDVASSLPYLRKGYSIFVVAHGSAPVYTTLDAVIDLQRAVRFIRYNAKKYEIDPDKIGVTGSSAGGQLSLICGLMDNPVDNNTGEPSDLVSSKVQAVACYYPPTDFLNWGAAGQNIMKSDLMKSQVFNHLFEIRKWNPQRRFFSYITDTTEINKILFDISPINHVSANDAPVLILHGDNDQTVPLRQSELLVKKLQEVKVPAVLTIKKGGGHGWDRDEAEIKMFIDWFDKYLK
jgi:acetyl esterase/lipase